MDLSNKIFPLYGVDNSSAYGNIFYLNKESLQNRGLFNYTNSITFKNNGDGSYEIPLFDASKEFELDKINIDVDRRNFTILNQYGMLNFTQYYPLFIFSDSNKMLNERVFFGARIEVTGNAVKIPFYPQQLDYGFLKSSTFFKLNGGFQEMYFTIEPKEEITFLFEEIGYDSFS